MVCPREKEILASCYALDYVARVLSLEAQVSKRRALYTFEERQQLVQMPLKEKLVTQNVRIACGGGAGGVAVCKLPSPGTV